MHWLRAFRDKIGVEKCEMGELVLGVIMDVLVHIPIQNFQGSGVDRISSSARDFAVLVSPEFVILHPEIGLEDLRRSRESEHGGIARCDRGAVAKRF